VQQRLSSSRLSSYTSVSDNSVACSAGGTSRRNFKSGKCLPQAFRDIRRSWPSGRGLCTTERLTDDRLSTQKTLQTIITNQQTIFLKNFKISGTEGQPSGLAATEVLSSTPAAANLLAGTSSNPLRSALAGRGRKGPNGAFMAHYHRELYHAQWAVIMDEFLEAYVRDCDPLLRWDSAPFPSLSSYIHIFR